ncbi:MAG: MBL fold hydrolase [Pelagibacteraceae bacterium]|nr:MBL fold hydrolase [Pelagibacteraceae bacterium]|tara:strand:+ start:15558 stop:17234 length:1677 start_codon:yes stop_codon:yes gene_type:complete
MLNHNILINSDTTKGLYFLPVGGVGEIGANCYLYCCDDSWIMIDLGISFADDQYPGIDLLVPRLDILDYLKNKLKAIIISHAHEDHAGALSYFTDKIKCPIYATNFACNMIKQKMKENKKIDSIKLKKIDINKSLKFKNFELDFISTTHSIPEPYAIRIKTSYGNILHTADWKIDDKPVIGNKFDSTPFTKLGDEGVLALIGDSTNAQISGYSKSENEVNKHLPKLFSRYSGRIVITCFSSNIARIKSIINAAKENNRKVSIAGRSIDRTIEAARQSGYFDEIESIIHEDKLKYVSKEELVIICTGSQGEKRSALYRMAYNSHQHIKLENGDVVIFSSRDIPGNEKSINNLKNLIIRQKVDIVTGDEEMVHVSGHGYADELKDMYQWTRPYVAVPVHGEYLHLVEHAKIAQSCQVPVTKILDNGLLLKIAPNKPEIIEKIDTGKMVVEGKNIYNSESDFIRERKKYSYDGIFMVTLLLHKDKSIDKNITITQYGLAIDNMKNIIDNFKLEFTNQYINLKKEKKFDDSHIQALSKKVIRSYFNREYKKKPEVQTHIIHI